MYAGKMAKGFKAAQEKGLVFVSPYDGHQKFEIDDSSAELSVNHLAKLDSGEDVPLQSIFVHPHLYEQYPVLSGILVKAGVSDYDSAQFNHQSIQIDLNKQNVREALASPERRQALLSSIAHEAQHAVQFVEALDLSSNASAHYVQMLASKRQELGLRPSETHLVSEDVKKDLHQQAFRRYLNHPCEIEARDTEHRISFTSEQRQRIQPYSTESIPVQHATPPALKQQQTLASLHLRVRQLFHGTFGPDRLNRHNQAASVAALYANGSYQKAHDYIVAHRVNPNTPIDLGEGQKISLAHYAISLDQTETINHFVKDGTFNPKSKHDGLSPIHLAKSSRMIALLAGADVDLDAKRPYNGIQSVTALHVASINNNTDVLSALIAKGANVHARDQFSNTPLHYAKDPSTAHQLIRAGADLRAINKFDRTPQIEETHPLRHQLRLVADLPETEISNALMLSSVANQHIPADQASRLIRASDLNQSPAPHAHRQTNSAILQRFETLSRQGAQIAMLRPVASLQAPKDVAQYQSSDAIVGAIASLNPRLSGLAEPSVPEVKLSAQQMHALSHHPGSYLVENPPVKSPALQAENQTAHQPLPDSPLPVTKVIEEHPIKPETITHPDFWTGAGGMTTLEQKEAGRADHGFAVNNNPNDNMPKPRLVTEMPVDLAAPLPSVPQDKKRGLRPPMLTPAVRRPAPSEPDLFGRPTPFGTEYDN